MSATRTAAPGGQGHKNLVQMFQRRVVETPDRAALRYKRDGVWRTLTWRDWELVSRQLAAGLRGHLGVRRGDRIAILARTRIEWPVCDLAIALAGAISVPIHPDSSRVDMTEILRDSGCVGAFVSHDGGARRLRRCASPEAALSWTVALADDASAADLTFRHLRAEGTSALVSPGVLEDVAGTTPAGEDLTWVYTSGTTGVPKGAVLSHDNAVSVAQGIRSAISAGPDDEQLLVLPLAHVFARHMIWVAMATGTVTSFSTFERLETDLIEVAPTFLAGVPRMFEKFHERIHDRVLTAEGVVQRNLLDWGLEIGREVSELRRSGRVVPTPLAVKMAVADRAMFARIRQRFGDRLRFLISGSAPLATAVAEFFHAAGILILEGYGLTETSGAIAVNRPERFRFGTVGPAIPGAEIRIAGDGEVLVRGRTVMTRYRGGDGRDEAFDADGWLHTGDLGELSAGFLRITGRKKDLVITSLGKNIAPRPLEDFLRARTGVAQAVVLGDRRPYLVALVTIDAEAMMGISQREGLGCRTYADLAQHARIRQLVQEHVDDLNATRARFEQIRKFAIPLAPFSAASGELTASLKVKRGVVQHKYRDLIDRLYESGGPDEER